MRIERSLLATILIAVVVAATVVAVAAGGSTADKQRVEIDGMTSMNQGKFQFLPLTAGALKGDSGKVVESELSAPTRVIRRGQDVFVLSPGTETYNGANGYLIVLQKVEQVGAGPYSVYTGTWKVVPSTGVYKGYTGGGTYVAVERPTGGVFFREQGYLTKP